MSIGKILETYTVDYVFDYTKTNKFNFSHKGETFTICLYRNYSDDCVYMDIYNNISKKYLIQGIKCTPNRYILEERNYLKSDYLYKFDFVFAEKNGGFTSKDILYTNIVNDFDLFFVVHE